jgi:hypothetical protein
VHGVCILYREFSLFHLNLISFLLFLISPNSMLIGKYFNSTEGLVCAKEVGVATDVLGDESVRLRFALEEGILQTVDDGRVEGEGGAVQVRGVLCEVLGGPSSYNGGGTSVGKESAEGVESRFQRRPTTEARDEQNPALDKGSW